MTGEVNTRQPSDLKGLALPASPSVVRLLVEDYTDSEGEPTVRVLAVLDEKTDLKKVGGAAVGELKSAIRAGLQRSGITAFPYIFLAKPSELVEEE